MMKQIGKKQKNEEKNIKMFIKNSECTYVYIGNTDKNCDLSHDRSVLL
jgi:hypothetical protein